MLRGAALLLLLSCGLAATAIQPAWSAPVSREKALAQLSDPKALTRRSAVVRLGDVGRMRDTAALSRILFDDDEETRGAAEAALWRLWSRSGVPRVDALYKKGLDQMNSGDAERAVATFSEVIRLKPEFAEGWNKRATVLFFMERYKESMADCEEVIKRNPLHFGALSGYGQNHARLENFEKALEYFERALAVNPNMHGVALNILGLRKLISEKARRAI
jgi:tetratricopeptide (TPR) repeat protein